MSSLNVLRYSAFAASPGGGNPAGVVLDADHLDDAVMQEIAAEVGYSETAFVAASQGPGLRVRYFAPEGEVDFCGHATIASAAALAKRHGDGDYAFLTNIGQVDVSGRVETGLGEAGGAVGSFRIPRVDSGPLGDDDLGLLLDMLGWSRGDLHPAFPPAVGTSGNLHPVLVAEDLRSLQSLEYPFEALQALSREREWITLQLIAPVTDGRWRARDPFPWGGVVEDPATGSAAAAFLGYLRAQGRIDEGESITIEQGVEMGRPSVLTAVSAGDGARISGAAAPII